MPYFKTPNNLVAWLDANQPESLLPDGSIPITQEQADALRMPEPFIPSSVTMRQARLALLGAGLLAGVDAAIAALPSPTKEAAAIEWEYALTVERNSALVATLAGALNLGASALDDLFTAASAL